MSNLNESLASFLFESCEKKWPVRKAHREDILPPKIQMGTFFMSKLCICMPVFHSMHEEAQNISLPSSFTPLRFQNIENNFRGFG